MLNLTPIPALETNYIWALRSAISPKQVIIVDLGQAQPVQHFLRSNSLNLAAILVTHHHHDHTGGLAELTSQFNCPIYAGCHEPISQTTHPLRDGENIVWPELALTFTAIHIPGHTKGHTAFYGHELVFTGDTLFAAGCGRNFEGTPEQLYASLQKLGQLPRETQIYCGHEYTEQNLRFGLTVEPDNTVMQQKLTLVQLMRAEQQCTLPSSFADEFNTNVFLRCDQPSVIKAAEQHCGKKLTSAVEVFTVLREWKNHW